MISKTDLHIMRLQELAEEDFTVIGYSASAQLHEALDAAQDALAFSQALWDLFADQALHDDGDEPNFGKMENIVDAINGELAAAVLLLNSLNIDERILLRNAELLEKHNGQLNGFDPIPQVVIDGNKRLAVRIKNTKIILAAKNRTKLIIEPEKA